MSAVIDDHGHAEAEPQVQGADVLVVGGQYPAHQALGRAMSLAVCMAVVIDNSTHVLTPANSWTKKPGTAMAAFGKQLSEVDIAAVVTYERNAWGNNKGDMVTPKDVLALKQAQGK